MEPISTSIESSKTTPSYYYVSIENTDIVYGTNITTSLPGVEDKVTSLVTTAANQVAEEKKGMDLTFLSKCKANILLL